MSKMILTFGKKLHRLVRKTSKKGISGTDFLIVMYSQIDTVVRDTLKANTDPKQRQKILQGVKDYHNAHTQVLVILETMYGDDENGVTV